MVRVGGPGRRSAAGSVGGVDGVAGVHAGRWRESGGALSVDFGRGGAAGEERPRALRRSVPRRILGPMPALAALKAAQGTVATREPA